MPHKLVGDLVESGQSFLDRNAKQFTSETETHVPYKDNFADLLILEATNNWSLISIEVPRGTWNFFGGSFDPVTATDFPDDLDTTSLASTIIRRDLGTANLLMDEMLKWANADGILQVFYDRNRPRIDPAVATNILTLFYSYGRGHEVRQSFEWVYDILLYRSYAKFRYYFSPEPFFYYLGRLLRCSTDHELHSRLKPLLKERMGERIGTDNNPLGLAIRVLLCEELGISNEVDYQTLLTLQQEDGSWGIGWIYQYGQSKTKVGNRFVTAALAIKAVKAKMGTEMAMANLH